MNLIEHLIAHEILGVSSGGGGGVSQTSNYWGYQDLDTPNSTSITLTQNENADSPQQLGNNIINNTAVLTTLDGKAVYKNTTFLLTNKISVTSHSGTSVSVSDIVPSSEYPKIRIWFLMKGVYPNGAKLAPKFVTKKRLEMLEAAFVNQFGDILYGDLDFNSYKAKNLSLPTSNGEPLIYGNDGEVYFFDTSRNKKLSISQFNFIFGRNNANISSNQYLRTIDRMPTNQNSVRLPYNSTLIGMIVSSKNSGNEWSGRVKINDDSTIYAHLDLGTSDVYKIDNTLDVDLNQGDLIKIHLKITSGTIEYPFVQLFFRRRG